MLKFVNMLSFFYAPTVPVQEEKNADNEDFEIIENVYKGPGGIDKIFEWHNKNKIIYSPSNTKYFQDQYGLK